MRQWFRKKKGEKKQYLSSEVLNDSAYSHSFFLPSFLPSIHPSIHPSILPSTYCLWRTPCSCLHLLLGCAPVLSAHVKLCSVLHLWLPSLTHLISISMFLSLSFTFIHLSISLCPVAFPSLASYLLFSSLLKAIWAFHLSLSTSLPSPCLSRVHSLTPLISLSPLPAVSTSDSCLPSICTYLPPLFLSNGLHLHTLLVNYLVPDAAIRNCLLCLDNS